MDTADSQRRIQERLARTAQLDEDVKAFRLAAALLNPTLTLPNFGSVSVSEEGAFVEMVAWVPRENRDGRWVPVGIGTSGTRQKG